MTTCRISGTVTLLLVTLCVRHEPLCGTWVNLITKVKLCQTNQLITDHGRSSKNRPVLINDRSIGASLITPARCYSVNFRFCYYLVVYFLVSPLQLSSILRIKVLRPSSYHEAKQAATEYHSAKQALIKAFHKAGLGAWVKKPIEQDQFTLCS